MATHGNPSWAHGIQGRDASNVIVSMFRQAWNAYCRERNLREYVYSKATGFHCTIAQAKLGQKVPWGKQGDRRSSMLRNIARGQVWEFGVSALPAFWPFPHIKMKSRVLIRAPASRRRRRSVRRRAQAAQLKAVSVQRLAQQAMAWPSHGFYRDAIRGFGVDRDVARRVSDNQARSRAHSIFVAYQHAASELLCG